MSPCLSWSSSLQESQPLHLRDTTWPPIQDQKREKKCPWVSECKRQNPPHRNADGARKAAGHLAAIRGTLSRSPTTVNTRRITAKIVPKPCDGLFGQSLVGEPSAIPIENGEFVLGHDIRGRLREDPMPYFPRRSFEDRVDRRGVLALLVVLDNLERFSQSHMIV